MEEEEEEEEEELRPGKRGLAKFILLLYHYMGGNGKGAAFTHYFGGGIANRTKSCQQKQGNI